MYFVVVAYVCAAQTSVISAISLFKKININKLTETGGGGGGDILRLFLQFSAKNEIPIFRER